MVVKVDTHELRHTGIHAATGDWPVQPHLPFVISPEVLGSSTASAGVSHRAAREEVGVQRPRSSQTREERHVTGYNPKADRTMVPVGKGARQ